MDKFQVFAKNLMKKYKQLQKKDDDSRNRVSSRCHNNHNNTWRHKQIHQRLKFDDSKFRYIIKRIRKEKDIPGHYVLRRTSLTICETAGHQKNKNKNKNHTPKERTKP